MKRLTLSIAADEAFGRSHGALRAAGARGRLLAVQHRDARLVELCAFDGDPDAVAAALAETPGVVNYEVTAGDGGPTSPSAEPESRPTSPSAEPESRSTSPSAEPGSRSGYAYVQVEPDETVSGLLDLLSTHGLLLDTPIALGRDAVTVDVVGTQSAIHAAADALPPSIRETVTVEHLGDYTPDGGAFDHLTARQREVAAAAVRVGYYDTPRRATLADVAAAADCATSTASEHLRKAEATLFQSLLKSRT